MNATILIVIALCGQTNYQQQTDDYQQQQQQIQQQYPNYPSIQQLNLQNLYQKALQEPLTEEEQVAYNKLKWAVEMQRREALVRINRVAAYARMNERARNYVYSTTAEQNIVALQGQVQQAVYAQFFNGVNYGGWNNSFSYGNYGNWNYRNHNHGNVYHYRHY